MVSDMRSLNRSIGAPKAQPSYLAEVAETIRDDALMVAEGRLSPVQSHARIEEVLKHPAFFDYFKYELSRRVAEVLVALDEPVHEIYLYDTSASAGGGIDCDLSLDATVRLLVVVASHSATLDAWVAALDSVLTDSLRELPSHALARRSSILDVIQISVEEARYCPRRRRMLSSVFAPPIRIWGRE